MVDLPEFDTSDYSSAITVVVGETKKTLPIYNEIATKSSSLFRKAFQGECKEGQENTINLPDTSAESVRAYIHWLHHDEFPKLKCPQSLVADTCVNELDWYETMHLHNMEIYILADYLRDFVCQNAMMNETITLSYAKFGGQPCYPGEECIQRIWDRLPERSFMKHFILQSWAKKAIWDGVVDCHKSCPVDFCALLAGYLTLCRPKAEGITLPPYASRCDYHRHDEELAPMLDWCHREELYAEHMQRVPASSEPVVTSPCKLILERLPCRNGGAYA